MEYRFHLEAYRDHLLASQAILNAELVELRRAKEDTTMTEIALGFRAGELAKVDIFIQEDVPRVNDLAAIPIRFRHYQDLSAQATMNFWTDIFDANMAYTM